MRLHATAALALAALLPAMAAQGQTPPQSGNPNVIITPRASMPAQPVAALSTAKRIKRDEAIKMVKEGKAIWLDVRANDQYQLGHIKGAINIPVTQLMDRLREVPPKKYIITYCA
jgi:3-mercaptopyruvate sulfurtransferase SseA